MKIGIDLGTTNSAMAYTTEDGRSEVIKSDGERTTPSVVLIEEQNGNESITVGGAANRKRLLSPERVLERTKQDIDAEEDVTYEIDGTEYSPIDAAGYVLGKLRADAEQNTGEDIESAVITVPYDFGDRGRKATKDAAAIADLDVEEIINEPTAACLKYIHDNDVEGTVLVYDLGGGTFDATLVEAGANIDVISTEGDGQLGGEDFDDALYDHFRQQLIDDGYPDPEENIQKKDSLRKSLKELKEGLSSNTDEGFAFDTGDGMANIEITREDFNHIIGDMVDQTIQKLDALFEKDAVQEEGIDVDDIDRVLMVGGSTRVPLVRDRVEKFFGQKPAYDADADTVVSAGAALQAAFYDDRVPIDVLPQQTIRDTLSHSLGVETDEGLFDRMFEEDTSVPETHTKPYRNPASDEATIVVRAVEKGKHGDPVDPDEGESEAEVLGDFTISNVPGEAKVNVTYEVEMDGTLHVEAETEDGKSGQMTIDDEIGLSTIEIEERKLGQGDKQSPAEEFGLEPDEGDDDRAKGD